MRPKTNDLKVELGYLSDNAIEWIAQGKTDLVVDALEMYLELVATFIDKLKQWGSGYDKKRAMEEITALGEGWSEIEWIENDVRKIIDASINTPNMHIIRETVFFPVHLATLAFNEGDYYIFHKFINWVPYFYNTSFRIKDEDLKKFIADRCWRHTKETADLIIFPIIRRSTDTQEIEAKADFAFGMILVFNQLLKLAYDKKEEKHFTIYIQALNSLFEYHGDQPSQSDVNHTQWLLERETNDELKRKYEAELSIQKKHVWFTEQITEKKRLVLFGINAWILHRYDTDRLVVEEFNKWHDTIPPFGDLYETWDLFLKATEHDTERDYGWHWWEMDEREMVGMIDSGAAYIRSDDFFQLLFCIRVLELMKAMSPTQLSSVSVPHSRKMLYLADGPESPLLKKLGEMTAQPKKWGPILGKEGFACIDSFKSVLARAVDLQKQDDTRLVVESPLCPEKVEEVKNGILKEWNTNAEVRRIVKDYGIYKNLGIISQDDNFFGFNKMDRKDLYVKESGVTPHGWGEQYGVGLADGENKSVLSQIMPSLSHYIEQPVKVRDVVRIVSDALSKLENSGYKPIILILNSWSASRTLEASDVFTYPEKADLKPRLLGFFKKRPAFSLHLNLEPSILIVDLKKLGIWKQYKPKQIFPDEVYVADEFTFLVKPYTRESALDLIQKNPQIRRDNETGQDRPVDEVVRELQQRVHLRILEQFEFQVMDINAGYKISLEDR